jgi:hypothetical protein
MHKPALNRPISYLVGLLAIAGSLTPLRAATTACTAAGLSFATMITDGGCYTTDKLFSGFALATSTGSSGHYPGSTARVAMETTGGGYSGDSTNPIDQNFITTGTAAWEETTGASASGGFAYTAAVDSNLTTNPDYQAPPTAGFSWAISSIFVSMSTFISLGNNAGNSVTVTEQFCLGQATITAGCIGGSIFETDAGVVGPSFGTGTITPGIGTFNTQSDEFVFNSGFLYSEIAIQDIVSITRASGTIEATSIQNDFGEDAVSPEPSTFVLLGGALAIIALLRYTQSCDNVFTREAK